jgi:chromosome segregation protein
LQDREAYLTQLTEDVARLMADSRKTRDRNEADAGRARDAAGIAKTALATAHTAEEAVLAAEVARSETQNREADARGERSEAEGEMNALRAEVSALARLVQRDTAEGGHILDRLQVEQGFEKALGAALADDLRAPEVEADGARLAHETLSARLADLNAADREARMARRG